MRQFCADSAKHIFNGAFVEWLDEKKEKEARKKKAGLNHTYCTVQRAAPCAGKPWDSHNDLSCYQGSGRDRTGAGRREAKFRPGVRAEELGGSVPVAVSNYPAATVNVDAPPET
jgi:hypothetical protein